MVSRPVAAQEGVTEFGEDTGLPLHPTFPLLDEDGTHVLDSGGPVSTMTTCGGCHDTSFIAGHSFHADAGLGTMTTPGGIEGGRAWDTSSGLFGGWNPITYRYLSPEEDDRTDLSTAEWLKIFGVRHVGGGPAVYSRDGRELTALYPSAESVETSIIDPVTGETTGWDWQESGVVEMNCFICHMSDPDNEARKESLHQGEFQWANSATLQAVGVIAQTSSGWRWNAEAFDGEGNLLAGSVVIQDPGNDNCGLCHGLVHVEPQTPVFIRECTPEQWSTITTGQIMSPQKIAESGINLAGKEGLRRSWDIHAERVVKCTECHYSLNNPVYYQELTESRPDSLIFDPRRLDLGEYLYRPLHQFAKGESSQDGPAPRLDNTMRTCADCHDAEISHDWLPYTERHMRALSCESCHVPHIYAPAREYNDWTVLDPDGKPVVTCRGVEGGGGTFATALITGYEPVLLPLIGNDGDSTLAPHNLITSWYWVYGDPERPVPYRDLRAAWLDGGEYPDEIMDVFDVDGSGDMSEIELTVDSDQKESVLVSRLEALGLRNPHIVGEVQPYAINHSVTHGEWATSDCQTCHSEDSRVSHDMLLADRIPGGIIPENVGDAPSSLTGELVARESGELYYRPTISADELYVLGHSNVSAVDWAGVAIFLGVMVGVVVHGGLRFNAARRLTHQEPETRQVYMYTMYERLWHWLQTATIFLLLFTGLIIHKPDMFGLFSFRYVVEVHNMLAFILVANAALALFYHLASGEIKRYVPQPRGFFDQAISQTLFYVRGMFKGDAHPFEKTPQRRLNPLQQITYLGLLNVLLPLQVITGILMWGAQRWPAFATQIGGLTYLGPIHTMISWLLASFIVMHVYLTTTGVTPSAAIRSMMTGWDQVEVREVPAPGD
jgi:thiosulfate reductase cytochrome b subunit